MKYAAEEVLQAVQGLANMAVIHSRPTNIAENVCRAVQGASTDQRYSHKW